MSVIIHIAFSVFSLFFLVGCSTYYYDEQAAIYRSEAISTLISSGICNDEQDCMKKQIMVCSEDGWKVGPWQGGGIEIDLYSISSLIIAENIGLKFEEIHKKNPSVNVVLNVFKSANPNNFKSNRKELLRSFSFEKV